mmetsp:Transcript_28080/g.43687  ORF Transcript_28080/g.43687 Transcript_28080/m.43687 type:complete len:137 (-) Transcript_28080:193-603(-)|eukprot:CAMPEP_0196821790 /NCGR_PEP_ID=MMETSP1362-20130617/80905_1 /TAXON_ID=163516 /ORGANISM="Leptocylindrus danicus, Strain CCMP1856" /LENGTH=136 /DNA_ID=CAMNT_0042201125 /DNA_START=145 /DNA_END=555 /DNA_ORIENTATION=-
MEQQQLDQQPTEQRQILRPEDVATPSTSAHPEVRKRRSARAIIEPRKEKPRDKDKERERRRKLRRERRLEKHLKSEVKKEKLSKSKVATKNRLGVEEDANTQRKGQRDPSISNTAVHVAAGVAWATFAVVRFFVIG